MDPRGRPATATSVNLDNINLQISIALTAHKEIFCSRWRPLQKYEIIKMQKKTYHMVPNHGQYIYKPTYSSEAQGSWEKREPSFKSQMNRATVAR